MIIDVAQSITTLVGQQPGPTTTIMVGVHGNELSGPRALLQRLENISKKNEPPIQSGTVFCIFANLQALQYDVRYTDINMNRCFGKDIPQQNNDYEAQRVQELIPYLQQSDVLLDIHNTIDLPCPPFLISEHADWNRYFDVPRVLSGLDTLHPGGSDGYMNSIGKVGLCLECGSINDDLDITTTMAYNAISNFLCATGNNTKNKPDTYGTPLSIRCTDIYTSQFGQFRLARAFEECEKIQKNTLIGYDKTIPILAPKDMNIIFARDTENIGDECFVIGEEI